MANKINFYSLYLLQLPMIINAHRINNFYPEKKLSKHINMSASFLRSRIDRFIGENCHLGDKRFCIFKIGKILADVSKIVCFHMHAKYSLITSLYSLRIS
jgi:hypothetical protein